MMTTPHSDLKLMDVEESSLGFQANLLPYEPLDVLVDKIDKVSTEAQNELFATINDSINNKYLDLLSNIYEMEMTNENSTGDISGSLFENVVNETNFMLQVQDSVMDYNNFVKNINCKDSVKSDFENVCVLKNKFLPPLQVHTQGSLTAVCHELNFSLKENNMNQKCENMQAEKLKYCTQKMSLSKLNCRMCTKLSRENDEYKRSSSYLFPSSSVSPMTNKNINIAGHSSRIGKYILPEMLNNITSNTQISTPKSSTRKDVFEFGSTNKLCRKKMDLCNRKGELSVFRKKAIRRNTRNYRLRKHKQLTAMMKNAVSAVEDSCSTLDNSITSSIKSDSQEDTTLKPKIPSLLKKSILLKTQSTPRLPLSLSFKKACEDLKKQACKEHDVNENEYHVPKERRLDTENGIKATKPQRELKREKLFDYRIKHILQIWRKPSEMDLKQARKYFHNPLPKKAEYLPMIIILDRNKPGREYKCPITKPQYKTPEKMTNHTSLWIRINLKDCNNKVCSEKFEDFISLDDEQLVQEINKEYNIIKGITTFNSPNRYIFLKDDGNKCIIQKKASKDEEEFQRATSVNPQVRDFPINRMVMGKSVLENDEPITYSHELLIEDKNNLDLEEMVLNQCNVLDKISCKNQSTVYSKQIQEAGNVNIIQQNVSDCIAQQVSAHQVLYSCISGQVNKEESDKILNTSSVCERSREKPELNSPSVSSANAMLTTSQMKACKFILNFTKPSKYSFLCLNNCTVNCNCDNSVPNASKPFTTLVAVRLTTDVIPVNRFRNNIFTNCNAFNIEEYIQQYHNMLRSCFGLSNSYISSNIAVPKLHIKGVNEKLKRYLELPHINSEIGNRSVAANVPTCDTSYVPSVYLSDLNVKCDTKVTTLMNKRNKTCTITSKESCDLNVKKGHCDNSSYIETHNSDIPCHFDELVINANTKLKSVGSEEANNTFKIDHQSTFGDEIVDYSDCIKAKYNNNSSISNERNINAKQLRQVSSYEMLISPITKPNTSCTHKDVLQNENFLTSASISTSGSTINKTTHLFPKIPSDVLDIDGTFTSNTIGNAENSLVISQETLVLNDSETNLISETLALTTGNNVVQECSKEEFSVSESVPNNDGQLTGLEPMLPICNAANITLLGSEEESASLAEIIWVEKNNETLPQQFSNNEISENSSCIGHETVSICESIRTAAYDLQNIAKEVLESTSITTLQVVSNSLSEALLNNSEEDVETFPTNSEEAMFLHTENEEFEAPPGFVLVNSFHNESADENCFLQSLRKDVTVNIELPVHETALSETLPTTIIEQMHNAMVVESVSKNKVTASSILHSAYEPVITIASDSSNVSSVSTNAISTPVSHFPASNVKQSLPGKAWACLPDVKASEAVLLQVSTICESPNIDASVSDKTSISVSSVQTGSSRGLVSDVDSYSIQVNKNSVAPSCHFNTKTNEAPTVRDDIGKLVSEEKTGISDVQTKCKTNITNLKQTISKENKTRPKTQVSGVKRRALESHDTVPPKKTKYLNNYIPAKNEYVTDAEVADNTNPKWELHRFSSITEGIQSVASQWQSLVVPFPHKDLTNRYKWRIPNQNNTAQCSSNTYRYIPCISIYDNRITKALKFREEIQSEIFSLRRYMSGSYRIAQCEQELRELNKDIDALFAIKNEISQFYDAYFIGSFCNPQFLTESERCAIDTGKSVLETYDYFYRNGL